MSSRADRGFTILEAVVALAIVGLAGVAALEAVGGEIRGIDRAREAYTTAALAQDRLATITVLPPEDLNPLPDSLARGTFAEPFKDYRWTATLHPLFGERDRCRSRRSRRTYRVRRTAGGASRSSGSP